MSIYFIYKWCLNRYRSTISYYKSKGGFILRVRQRCDEQYNCCVATIVFSSCCLVNLMKKKIIISDGNYSATVAITVKIISTLLWQLAMILATKIFASDSQRWRALLRRGSDVESDISNPSYRCRTRSINLPYLFTLINQYILGFFFSSYFYGCFSLFKLDSAHEKTESNWIRLTLDQNDFNFDKFN